MPTEKKILIATDIPFWRAATGAEQRIDSLARWLIGKGHRIRILMLAESASLDALDQRQVADRSLDIDYRSSHQPPHGRMAKMGWYLDAIRNRIFTSANRSSTSPTDDSGPAHSLHLEDFRWPWAIRAFRESLQEFDPDLVLIEYVKLAYLLEGIPANRRASIRCAIDTHDVMYLRNEQFRQAGQAHWLDISRDEEIEALKRFDCLIAIQPEEADYFRAQLPEHLTIICSHHCPSARFIPGPFLRAGQTPIRPVVGYLASPNASNVAAISNFLDQVWIETSESSLPKRMELLIAGRVGEALTDQQRRRCRVIGHVDDLDSFYQQVDLVINPVEFGTGLKIKSVEAISFGKPIVTTRQGSSGLPPDSPAIEICESVAGFSEPLLRWSDPIQLRVATEAARQVADHFFSQSAAYSEFDQVFAAGRNRSNG